MAAAPTPPTAPQEQVRDAFGRLVVVDLSGRAPGIHAPAQAPVRVLGSNTPTSLSTERWGDRVVDLGAPLLRREPRSRARGRTALVAACVAATLAVGGVVVVAMINQPGAFKVDIGDQLTVEPTVVPQAPTAEQPGPSVAVPSLLDGSSVVAPAPGGAQPGNVAPARPATAKTTAKASPKASTAKPSVKPSASPSAKPSTADPTPTPSPEPTKPSPEPTKPSPEPTLPSPDPTVTIPVPSPGKSLPTATAAPAVVAEG